MPRDCYQEQDTFTKHLYIKTGHSYTVHHPFYLIIYLCSISTATFLFYIFCSATFALLIKPNHTDTNSHVSSKEN